MNKCFIPENYKLVIYNKINSSKQRNLSVREYIRDFEQFLIKSSENEPLGQTIARFSIQTLLEVTFVLLLHNTYICYNLI